MDQFKGFLDKTECPFTWGLSDIDANRIMPMVVKLREKIEEKDTIDGETQDTKWSLKMTYGYELLAEDPVEAEKAVDEAIDIVRKSDEALIVKYKVQFLHIALSAKAWMIFKNGKNRTKELKELIAEIKPVSAMSKVEVSALLARKAQVFRYYGPDGTIKSMDWLREAVKKNPNEPEWKISLVVSMNRKRHFFKGVDIPWEQVEETVDILEEVLCGTDLTQQQVAKCKYLQAVAYHDYAMGKGPSRNVDECRRQVLLLCDAFHDKTDHPQYVTFAAERFAQSRGPEQHKAMKILNDCLDRFPNHVGVHTTACKILRRQKDWTGAAKHAKIAMEHGGYGASWLFLECQTKLGRHVDAEEFFDNLLYTWPEMYKKETHLGASLYYFLAKRDPVNGARHFEEALVEDPNFDQLFKPNFSYYSRSPVVPVDIAYNQVVLSLRSRHPREDELIMDSAKRLIERICIGRKFDTSKNLVDEALSDPDPRRGGAGRGRRFR